MTEKPNMQELEKIGKLVRYYILESTTEAGSGHPTSSLSAVELTTTLMFGGFFKFDADNPKNPNNDRLLFSKGHASPLLYSLWALAGKVSEEELLTLRKFGSKFEGHPMPSFEYAEAATGSLGQGLSVGVGIAINGKYIGKLPYKVFVLLGDSEMAEGSVWEALELAAYHKLDNLIGVLDVNRLGQSRETMYGHDLEAYAKRVGSFGWHTITIDGHNIEEVAKAYEEALSTKEKPVMIIAKTLKGKGVSFIENKDGLHGKPLTKEQLPEALKELGEVDKSVLGTIAKPENMEPAKPEVKGKFEKASYEPDTVLATRKVYGKALARIFPKFQNIVALDAEVSNSTFSKTFRDEYPERYFEMFIAEQNMVGTAIGLSNRGKIPFVSTFAAFLSRAYDQIRMSQYSQANIKIVGSHVGVSIGQDGPSQMGLEDLAMFRAILNSVVLYPSDAISADKLVEEAAAHKGLVYIRTTRKDTPLVYGNDEEFKIGGSKVVKSSNKDSVTVVAAGITLHEALAAYEELKAKDINIRVIDLYSVKPVDSKTLEKATKETKAIITVEDHFPEGGLGEAVKSALANMGAKVHSLAVTKMPKSGSPDELLEYEGISKSAIVKKVEEVV